MKTFNELYYIENTAWKSKLNLDDIKKFKTIKYSNSIIIHFDFLYSLMKVTTKQKAETSIFVSAINICFRLYEIIKKLYPYNNVYVIIHTRKTKILNLNIDYDTFKTIIDILPNFAIITKEQIDDLSYFDSKEYKHIFYGRCNNITFDNSECQYWSIFKGNLIVK